MRSWKRPSVAAFALLLFIVGIIAWWASSDAGHPGASSPMPTVTQGSAPPPVQVVAAASTPARPSDGGPTPESPVQGAPELAIEILDGVGGEPVAEGECDEFLLPSGTGGAVGVQHVMEFPSGAAAAATRHRFRDGRLTLPGSRSARLLAVRARDHVAETVAVPAGATSARVLLEPGDRRFFRIADRASSLGVRGTAEVMVALPARPPELRDRMESDDDGRVEIALPREPSTTVHLRFSREGFQARMVSMAQGSRVGLSDSDPFPVALERATSVVVRVRDAASDTAIPGASVRAGRRVLGTTGASGEVEVSLAIGPPMPVLEAVASGYAPRFARVPRDAAAGGGTGPVVVELRLERGWSLRGTVLEEDGSPPPRGTRVYLQGVVDEAREAGVALGIVREAPVEEEGRYSFSDLSEKLDRAGMRVLAVAPDGRAAQALARVEAGEGLALRLPPATGRVEVAVSARRLDGRPMGVARVLVQLVGVPGSSSAEEALREWRRGIPGAQREFALAREGESVRFPVFRGARGCWVVNVAAPGCMPETQVVELAEGTASIELRLELRPVGLASGVVRWSDGTPCGGAHVVVTMEEGGTLVGFADPEGAFVLPVPGSLEGSTGRLSVLVEGRLPVLHPIPESVRFPAADLSLTVRRP